MADSQAQAGSSKTMAKQKKSTYVGIYALNQYNTSSRFKLEGRKKTTVFSSSSQS